LGGCDIPKKAKGHILSPMALFPSLNSTRGQLFSAEPPAIKNPMLFETRLL